MGLKKHYSNNHVSKLKCIDVSNIRKWVNFYQHYGKAGFLPRKNQSYTLAFKLKVLKAIDKQNLSLRETSLKFNIPDTAIILKWKRDFANFGL